MRKLLSICLAAAVLASCAKEKIVTQPCSFDIKLDYVKGSRVQFTVKPDNPSATYVYGLLVLDEAYDGWTDQQLIDWQLSWMTQTYKAYEQDDVSGSFADIFCYKGERTIKNNKLSSDLDWILLVFQVNPKTMEAIGPLYKLPFHTLAIPRQDISFTLYHQGDHFTIVPSDSECTWFWEYETEDKIIDVYGSPYYFYYDIIDLYLEYDFINHLLCRGPATCTLPEDDRSIKEGVKYTISISGCSAEGEITTDVYYVDFIYHPGHIEFPYSDIEIVDENQE